MFTFEESFSFLVMFSIHIIIILFIKGIIQKGIEPLNFDKLQFLDKLVSPTLRLYALTVFEEIRTKARRREFILYKNVKYSLENK